LKNSLLVEEGEGNKIAKFLSENGKRATAIEILSPRYNAFVEGFDIPDLKDAKTLLDALA